MIVSWSCCYRTLGPALPQPACIHRKVVAYSRAIIIALSATEHRRQRDSTCLCLGALEKSNFRQLGYIWWHRQLDHRVAVWQTIIIIMMVKCVLPTCVRAFLHTWWWCATMPPVFLCGVCYWYNLTSGMSRHAAPQKNSLSRIIDC